MDHPQVYLDVDYKFHFGSGITVNELVSDEVKALASAHWLSFPPAHPFLVDIIAIFYAILSTVNISANGFIIFLFIKEKSLRTPSNLFILNLAVSDLLMLLTNGVPIAIAPFIGNYWTFGSVYCTIYAYAGGVSGVVAIWTMVFIGYDRYINITNKYKGASFTFTKTTLAIIFIWMYPALVMLPPALGVWSKYSLEGLLNTCSFEYCTDTIGNASYVIFLFFTSYVMPMCFIINFYYFIGQSVRKFFVALRNNASEHIAFAFHDKIASESKINRISITSVLLWLVAWTPYAIVCLVGQFGPRHLVTPLVSQIPAMVAKTCTVFNCVTFGFSHPHIRKVAAGYFPGVFGSEEATNQMAVQDKYSPLR